MYKSIGLLFVLADGVQVTNQIFAKIGKTQRKNHTATKKKTVQKWLNKQSIINKGKQDLSNDAKEEAMIINEYSAFLLLQVRKTLKM